MENLISVIIPVYNAGKYLAKCVGSILSQSYEIFEIILVDDGSKDNSGKICDEYAATDSRIRVIHKKNGGVSSARNTGIENAKGEFIAFVDSDDWFENNALEILYNEIKTQNADLSAGSFVRIMKKGIQRHAFKSALYNGNEIAENIVDLISLLCGPVWGKLFRRDIIIDKNIRFNPEIPMLEDNQFLMTYLQFCNRITLKDEIVYNYDCTVPTSAAHKFYQKYDFYCSCVSSAAIEVVRKSNIDETEKNILSHGLSNRFCCLAANYYMMHISANSKLKQKLRDAVSLFKVSAEKECFCASKTKLFRYDEFVLLAERNIDEFLKLYKRNLIKNDPVRYIKYILRPVLKKS